MLWMLLKGILAGIFYSFPCMSQAVIIAKMARNPETVSHGFIAGIAHSLVQSVFALIAITCLHLAIRYLHIDYRSFALIGAIILFLLAISYYRTKPIFLPPETLPDTFSTVFTHTLGYSLLFPIRLIGYFALFGAISLYSSLYPFYYDLVPFIGTFVGSMLFWCVFIVCVKKSHHFFFERLTESFARTCAISFIVFSLIGLIQVYFY